MRSKILILLSLLFSSIFSQKLDFSNSIEKNNLNIISLNNTSSEFYITIEGNSDLNLCFGDLKGRVAWIPPGISGGVPFNNLDEINEAINNGYISENSPIVDPLSLGNYFIGPYIYSDDNCDGEFSENETQMNNISELSAGCYLVYVIDALGNQSEINSITISGRKSSDGLQKITKGSPMIFRFSSVRTPANWHTRSFCGFAPKVSKSYQ